MLQIILEVQDKRLDDQALYFGASATMGLGSALVARIQPKVDEGVQIVIRDAAGEDLIEIHVPLQVAQDLLDGLIQSDAEMWTRVSLRDLRLPEAHLSLAGALSDIGKDVEQERGWQAKQEVKFQFITPRELESLIERKRRQGNREGERVYYDLLALLGLIDPELEWEPRIAMPEPGRIVSFYDLDEKLFYVIAEEGAKLNAYDKLDFIHEYVHALQDQHHGLSDLGDWEDISYDQWQALQALSEGEALQMAAWYFGEHLSPLEQWTVMQWKSEIQEEPADVPAIISRLDSFAYQTGSAFVEEIAPGGYWPALDKVYKNPPVSTEQVMHPERYKKERDDPQTVLLPESLSRLEREWNLIGNETLGEFFTWGYLADYVSPDWAVVAAEGWDGDQYILLENREDGRDMLVWKIAWDRLEDAREFVLAHRLAFGEGDEYRETVRDLHGAARRLRWESDRQCIYLEQKVNTTWLVITTRTEDLDLLLPLLKDGINA